MRTISQEVNSRPGPGIIIKVRLNKSFLSRKELTRHLSKGDDDDDVAFNSCNASEEGSESTAENSRECLVHPIDAAIVKELNERAEVTERDGTPMGRIRGAIQKKEILIFR